MNDVDDLAGGNLSYGSYTPFQLFAGDDDAVTQSFEVAANTAITKYQVLAVDANGRLVPHAPAASDTTAKALYVACQGMASNASVVKLPVYVEGYFNHEALVWDASLTTLAERQAAFRYNGADIKIGDLYGATEV